MKNLPSYGQFMKLLQLKSFIVFLSLGLMSHESPAELISLLNPDLSAAIDSDGDNTRDFTAHGGASADNTDQGWTGVSSGQRNWARVSNQLEMQDQVGDNSGAGAFLQAMTDGKATKGIVDITFDIDYTRDARRDIDLNAYVIGWNTGDAEARVDFGNPDVGGGDEITLNGATTLITESGVGAEGLFKVLENGVAQNGLTITDNDASFDSVSIRVDFGMTGYDFIGVLFYGEADDNGGGITETIFLDNINFGGNIIWQGASSGWDAGTSWSNWNGTDGNLNDGDVLVFNDTGSATTVTSVNTDFTTVLGSLLFLESTSYTINDGTGSLIFQDGGGIINNSSAAQVVDVALAGRGSSLLLDSQTVEGGSLILNINATIDLSDTAGVTMYVEGSNDTTINSVISGTNGAVEKNSTGTLSLTGASANTYTGVTTINGGTVELNKTDGVNAISGDIIVASGGTLKLSADNQIANSSDVTLSGGIIDVANGSEGSTILGGMNSLVLTAASTFDYSGTGEVLRFENDTGSSAGVTLTIDHWGGDPTGGTNNADGDRLLLNAATFANIDSVVFTGWSTSYKYVDSGTGVYEVLPDVAVIEWNGSQDGNWGTNNNWTPAAEPNASDVVVRFDDTGIGEPSINVDGRGKTLGQMIFYGVGNDYTFTGADIIFDGNGGAGITALAGSDATFNNSGLILNDAFTINADTDSMVIVSAAISGAQSLTKAGKGTLLLSNTSNSYSGDTIIRDGVVQLGASAVIADASNMVLSGGTFHTGGFDETIGNLTMADNSIINMDGGDSVINWVALVENSWVGTLEIHNWDGIIGGGGSDQLLFSDITGFDKFSQIVFYSDNGVTAYAGSRLVDVGGGLYELTPVTPEASTWVIIGMLAGLIIWHEKKRKKSKLKLKLV